MKILNSKLVMTIMLIGVFLYAMPAFAFERAERITDREIIESLAEIKTEIKAIHKRIDDLKGEIKSLRELVYVVISGIFVLIGFVIWDRRTALAPAIRKSKELEEREERIERALRRYAQQDTVLAEILKEEGILQK